MSAVFFFLISNSHWRTHLYYLSINVRFSIWIRNILLGWFVGWSKMHPSYMHICIEKSKFLFIIEIICLLAVIIHKYTCEKNGISRICLCAMSSINFLSVLNYFLSIFNEGNSFSWKLKCELNIMCLYFAVSVSIFQMTLTLIVNENHINFSIIAIYIRAKIENCPDFLQNIYTLVLS